MNNIGDPPRKAKAPSEKSYSQQEQKTQFGWDANGYL